ncbi:Cytosine/adenosine deaminase [Paraburkholderia steynii]|uniref:Cytosine/adenosine deaminase n=2 Tax=Paraburkholderia steynii TaxID=1245441 RepID=A0A7Z7FKN7_9BURK|nr:Cytosine/adenosine deaminase [Paraburkholderia steynii]
MDPSIRDLVGDVLISGGKIVDVQSCIEAPDAVVIDARHKVLIPGLVNAHIHLWQTVLKGCGGNWTFSDYLHVLDKAGKNFTPDDVYLSTLTGAREQLESGVTTVFDWANILNTPDHADRVIDALNDSGIRAVLGHGTPGADFCTWRESTRLRHHDDVARVRRQRLSSNDTLVTLGLAVRGPDFATLEATRADIRLARSLDIMSSMHVAFGTCGGYVPNVRRLGEAGLLGPDINLTHGNRLGNDEIRMAVDLGTSITVTPETEMQMGHGFPVTGRIIDAGGNVTLGSDLGCSCSADMFSQMRFAVQFERAMANSHAQLEGRMPDTIALTARDVLRSATLQGARALGLAQRTGSITPGKDADLTLLSWEHSHLAPRDPVQAVVFHANASNVHTVMVKGELRKYCYQLLSPSEHKAFDARAASKRIVDAVALPTGAYSDDWDFRQRPPHGR